MRLGDHRDGREVEAVDALAGQQAGLIEIALNAPEITLGDFMLGERGQEAGGGPAFLVGLPGKVWPVHLDGGKAELVEEQGQPGAVNALGHAAARVGWLSSAS